MPITFPFPVRVSVGLVVAGVEQLRKFPGDLPTLGVTAAGQAMRLSMRVQQEFADLATRGDEVLSRIGGQPAERPAWATFDDEDSGAAGPVTSVVAVVDVVEDTEDEDADGYSGDATQELAEVIALDLAAAAHAAGHAEDDEYDGRSPDHADPDAATVSDSDADDDGPDHDGPNHGAPNHAESDEHGAPDHAGSDEHGAPDHAGSDEHGAPNHAESDEHGAPDHAESDEHGADNDGAEEHDAGDLEIDDDGASTTETWTTDNGAAGSPDAYESLTLAQLRGTLRRLSADQVTALLDRERAGADRPAFVTLLSNRVTSLEQGHP